jgi:hypothetical protein
MCRKVGKSGATATFVVQGHERSFVDARHSNNLNANELAEVQN